MILERYLTGEATGDERRRVEEELLVDEGALERLALAEDDLVDACARGELAPAAARHFLDAVPERRARVAIAGELQKIKRTRSWHLAPILAAAVAAVLVVARPAPPGETVLHLDAPSRGSAVPEVHVEGAVRLDLGLPPGVAADEVRVRLRRLEPTPVWLALDGLVVHDLQPGVHELELVDLDDQPVALYLFEVRR